MGRSIGFIIARELSLAPELTYGVEDIWRPTFLLYVTDRMLSSRLLKKGARH